MEGVDSRGDLGVFTRADFFDAGVKILTRTRPMDSVKNNGPVHLGVFTQAGQHQIL